MAKTQTIHGESIMINNPCTGGFQFQMFLSILISSIDYQAELQKVNLLFIENVCTFLNFSLVLILILSNEEML